METFASETGISLSRCHWAGTDPLYCDYHDHEWGVPVHTDQKLFEMLILEGAQAGLSWITILRRRSGYLAVFDQLDWAVCAGYSDEELEEKLLNPGIIRNRLKVFSVRSNALAFGKIVEEFGSFGSYLWAFVKGEPIVNQWESMSQVPATSVESDLLSKDLKKRGFKFVGSTIMYAYMQAVGMVNDHTRDCFLRGSHD